MSEFLEQNRLTNDMCAVMSKELQNQAINMYNMFGTGPECDSLRVVEFVSRNPNLHYRDGVGNANACVIDQDSDLRLNAALTNFREKEQLCTRWYQAGPNIGKGGLIANVESRLILSDDTQGHCQEVLAERNFDRFVPMLGCLKNAVQNPDNVIPPFERAGQTTRDFVKNDAYLQKCGFVNDGKTWRRAS